MKRRFKFEMGGSYVFYFGENLGEAILSFYHDRANQVRYIETITEEPIKEYELP